MVEPRSSFVDADNVRLHYLEWISKVQPDGSREEDNDNIPIVMRHALGATANSWQLVAAQLCHHHCILAFDLRGHGLSNQPVSDYNLATIAEDTISGMAKLGLGQVAIVGHGWGAQVGLVLAARHPALVSHLILVDCPLVEPRHWPDMTRERFIREREISPEIYISRTTYLDALQEEMASFWSRTIESIVLTQIHELPDGSIEERLSPECEYQTRVSLWEDRALSYYGKISCPVLLVPAAAQPRPNEEPPECLESAKDFAAAKGYIVSSDRPKRLLRNKRIVRGYPTPQTWDWHPPAPPPARVTLGLEPLPQLQECRGRSTPAGMRGTRQSPGSYMRFCYSQRNLWYTWKGVLQVTSL